MTTQVRKSRSGPLKPTPEDLKTAELLDFLSELDNGSEGMTAPRTPSLSGSVTSCEDDEDWDTDERVRRISSQLFSGTVVSWSRGLGAIKARSGTSYAFNATDLPTKDRKHPILGLPVLFEPQLRQSRPTARKVTIEWKTVLVRSLSWTWFGSAILTDALTLDGTCISWDTVNVRGVVALEAGSHRALISVSGIALDDVDRSTLSAGFPISLNFIRSKSASRTSPLFPCTLRIHWRGVLERYASDICSITLQTLLDPTLPAASKAPRLSTGRARSLRPLSATVMRVTAGKGALKAVHDGSLVSFAVNEANEAVEEIVKPGGRVFYWRAEGTTAIALLGRAPDGEKWPTLALCA